MVEWQMSEEAKAALVAMPDAGESTCPICGRHWTVTALEDCMLPSCGHFGHDTSAANPDRPCEDCGLAHASRCTVGAT